MQLLIGVDGLFIDSNWDLGKKMDALLSTLRVVLCVVFSASPFPIVSAKQPLQMCNSVKYWILWKTAEPIYATLTQCKSSPTVLIKLSEPTLSGKCRFGRVARRGANKFRMMDSTLPSDRGPADIPTLLGRRQNSRVFTPKTLNEGVTAGVPQKWKRLRGLDDFGVVLRHFRVMRCCDLPFSLSHA